jgi:HPt (histidine-containing phosphotransfer) domain-containing protein
MPLTRILLVDVSADGRARIAQAFPDLEKQGAIRAAACQDAVSRAEADRPDVILLGTSINNAALRTALSQRKTVSRIPVIVLADELAKAETARSTALAERVRHLFAEARLKGQLTHLEELGGPSFVREMIELFLETTPPRLQAASDGLVAGDLGAVELAAHSTKSAAANLGADELQELAARIEQLAAARQAAALSPLVGQLPGAFARISARLRQFISEP